MRLLHILSVFSPCYILANEHFTGTEFKEFDSTIHAAFTSKNHVYSPMAIRVMATALMRGTSGENLKELADVFNFDIGNDLENPEETGYLTYMYNTFKRERPNLQQSIIWASPKWYNMNPAYKTVMSEKMKLHFKRVKTFVGKEDYLNRQISQGTDGEIEDFFEKGSMTDDIKLMMLNSLKFEEKWHKDLKMRNGAQIDFFNLNEDNVGKVDTFRNTPKADKIVNYLDTTTGVQYVWLPFSAHDKKQPQMILALPPYLNGTDDSELDLFSGIDFEKARDVYKNRQVRKSKLDLIVPKFKFKTNIPLTEILKTVGVQSIFDKSKNPFDRLFKNPSGLYLSEAIHKSTIAVDEKGAKATAATAMQISSRSRPKTVKFDHPFKFFITNKRMTNIYFTGVVHKP
jgi:serpin B